MRAPAPLVFLTVLIGLVAAGSARLAAQEDTLVLDSTEVFTDRQRPPVTFNHAIHFDAYPDCVQCHHIFEYPNGKKKNVWDGEAQQCSECHVRDREEKRLPLMKAYHVNCTGCHRDLAKKGEKTGPVICGECHIRKK